MTETRECAATKERTAQSKILDLETQLSRITTEISQLQCSKQEVKISSNFVRHLLSQLVFTVCICDVQVEGRYQDQLQDMRDRLEQSDNTNRSLQNYVQFLKASYANVFGDLAYSSTLQIPSPIWLSGSLYLCTLPDEFSYSRGPKKRSGYLQTTDGASEMLNYKQNVIESHV